jgi:hypothetical protein
MKLVFRTVFFHFINIVIFSFLYFSYRDHFQPLLTNDKSYKTYINFLNLSITTQAGIGMTDLVATTYTSKLLLMFQQIILILTQIITFYLFSL